MRPPPLIRLRRQSLEECNFRVPKQPLPGGTENKPKREITVVVPQIFENKHSVERVSTFSVLFNNSKTFKNYTNFIVNLYCKCSTHIAKVGRFEKKTKWFYNKYQNILLIDTRKIKHYNKLYYIFEENYDYDFNCTKITE